MSAAHTLQAQLAAALGPTDEPEADRHIALVERLLLEKRQATQARLARPTASPPHSPEKPPCPTAS